MILVYYNQKEEGLQITLSKFHSESSTLYLETGGFTNHMIKIFQENRKNARCYVTYCTISPCVVLE